MIAETYNHLGRFVACLTLASVSLAVSFDGDLVLAQNSLFREPLFPASPERNDEVASHPPHSVHDPVASIRRPGPGAQFEVPLLVPTDSSNSQNHLPPFPFQKDLGVKQTGATRVFFRQDFDNKGSSPSFDQDGVEQSEEIIPRVPNEHFLGNRSTGQSQSISEGTFQRELIVQRYPDGRPQIEREMIQDEQGNYINDGIWRLLAPGEEKVVLAEGAYRLGKMNGIWKRKHNQSGAGIFSRPPFSQFDWPFTSIAEFKNNQLDGNWVLLDKEDQKMFEAPYREGVRHGTASWWYPSTRKMREATFKEGVLHGRLREWDEEQKMTRDEEFIDGQRVLRDVTYFRPQQPESEVFYLEPRLETDGSDDWWNAEPAPLVASGNRLKHGQVQLWYENGQPRMKGQHANNLRIGRFIWWHANGNKQLEGAYEDGMKTGRWIWWHENGIKSCEGIFFEDQPVEQWTTWNQEGQMQQRQQFQAAESRPQLPQQRDSNDNNLPEELPLALPPVKKVPPASPTVDETSGLNRDTTQQDPNWLDLPENFFDN